ncbi:hypothetical protein VTJ49DRAFT_6959 [Mycothermus thermophilus]|uniref:Uncharacterized protein n=1 Tax=Humicola insolens TaxID=85995 RepID=A0ABR3VI11_HUMIN
MPSTIYLIRHAESAHNPPPSQPPSPPSSVAVILTSPLTRTIQTTLAGFGAILDSRGAKLVLDPDLQERSDLPCDTGSEVEELRAKFPELEFGGLGEGWFVKEGPYAADDETVRKRAAGVRRRLKELADRLGAEGGERKDIVVVTHGVFMKFLAEDEGIDLPKAGWKAYRIEGRDGEDGPVIMSVFGIEYPYPYACSVLDRQLAEQEPAYVLGTIRREDWERR